MASQAEIDAAQDRAAELHEMWLSDQRTFDFHTRHGHPDADRYARRAQASRADYESAVRDLARAKGQPVR